MQNILNIEIVIHLGSKVLYMFDHLPVIQLIFHLGSLQYKVFKYSKVVLWSGSRLEVHFHSYSTFLSPSGLDPTHPDAKFYKMPIHYLLEKEGEYHLIGVISPSFLTTCLLNTKFYNSTDVSIFEI